MQLRDSGRGYSPVCLEGSTVCCTLVTVVRWVSILLYLTSFMPRIRSMKTLGTDQVFSRFFGKLWKGFLSDFSTAFSSHPSIPLYLWHHIQSIEQVIIFPFLKVVFETVYLRLGPKPMWQRMAGTLCYACSLSHEPSQKPWCLVSGPNEAHVQDISLKKKKKKKKNSVRDTGIGKKWICLDLERSTLHRVWAKAEGYCGGHGLWYS